MSGGRGTRLPSRIVRDGVLAVAGAVLVLGGAYGALIAIPFAPGAQARTAVLTALAMAAVAAALWRLLVVGARFRPLAGALGVMLAVPAGAFLATALVLLSDPDQKTLPSLAEVAELSMFMTRLTAVRLGAVTLPVAAAVGFLSARWCERRLRSFAAFA